MDELLGLDGDDLDLCGAEDASDDGRDVSRVARVSARDCDAAEFARAYVATSTPAVLTDCAGEAWWPSWVTVDFLAERYADAAVGIDGKKGRLGDFVERLDVEERYLRNVHLDDLLTEADASRLVMPPPLGANRVADHDVPRAWTRWFELFLLPRRCKGYPFLHRDMCCTSAYSLQLAGSKQFTLYAPDDAQYLYALPPSYCRSAIEDGGRSANLAAYPLFAKARPRHVRLDPGDLLFLPPDWWHTTRPTGDAHSLTLGGNYVTPETEELFAASFAEFRSFQELSSLGAARILR